MSYFSLRYGIYQHELRHLIQQFVKTILALVSLLVMALPFLLFIILFALGQIADPNVSLDVKWPFQIGLQMLLFLMVAIQRQGILGEGYRTFLSSANVRPAHAICVNVVLLVIATNIVLLGPLWLLVYFPLDVLFGQEIGYLLFNIINILIIFRALTDPKIPWIALLVVPIVATLFTDKFTISQLNLMLLVTWGATFVVPSWRLEWGRSSLDLGMLVLDRLRSLPFRYLIRVWFTLVVVSWLMPLTEQFAMDWAQAFWWALPFALIWGSYQFELLGLCANYRGFFLSCNVSQQRLNVISSLQIWTISLVSFIAISWNFANMKVIVSFALLVWVTQWSVINARGVFMLPCVTLAIAWHFFWI